MIQFGILRSIEDNELEMMWIWRNMPAVRANMYTQHVISYEEHLAWWTKTRRRTDQKYYMYELAGTPSGIAAFTDFDTENQTAAWAFYTAPVATRGAGSKMEYLMLERAFDTFRLHKLYCEVLAFNASVVKLHQKFGFKIEGIFREQRNVDGGFVDVYRLGILSGEWHEHRQAMYERLAFQVEVKK